MPSPYAALRSLLRQPAFPGLLASTLTLGIAFSFVAPFLSKWGTEEVGMSPKAFGLFMTVVSLSAIAVSTYLARLSDSRFSRRQMLILGSLGGVFGFAGYAIIRNPIALVLIGSTLHAVASICFAQLFSHVRETYKPDDSSGQNASFLMSVVRVCFSFAWTLGPAAGSLVLIAYGFRALFLAAAGLYLIFLLGIIRFVPEQTIQPQTGSQKIPSLWRTLKRPDLLLCFITFATVFAANAINMLNLPLAITRTLGGTERDFGIIFGIGPLVEIPLMLWFGHLAGKGYQLFLIRLGVAIMALYYFGLFFAYAPWHVYLLQILSGAGFAILTNVAILFFQDLVPGQMGLATSIFSNAGAVGNLLGMLSFGFIVEALGHQNAFSICAGLSLLALVMILTYRVDRVPKTSGTHETP
ncbi:transporter, major facilitator family [Verrucomicrobiia bacterium DG1235]|nr:transporter, major facilitator family [Verrucomicrobiae bacterium DG1235]